MRLSIAAVASLLALASAQGLAGLPNCAKTCATSAIPQECGLVDIKCICTATSFINAITCCVASSCSKEDQQKTINFAKGICGTVGVTNIPDSAVCSSGSGTPSPTPAPTPAPSSSGNGRGSGSGTGTGTGTVRTTPHPTTPTLTRTETTITTPTQRTSSQTSSSATRSPTPSAAAGNKIGVGAGAGAGLGLALGVLGML
ncbi:hypothetical protein GX50_08325 [[Emmonsia] crescens]|uniref:CFEM domain-containing protein n=1 Tax=[Emmonsia] crescens TaxID=73230 RepID=A0A2B7Z6S5_9EURO|nr:hypothetical protein GX50_08325 [Emmonsia crescens]